MSWSEALVSILMLVMGIQDLRARRVSNWLTIPFFLAGMVASLLRLPDDPGKAGFVLFIQGVVAAAGYLGWMGGADMKVFVGLLGLSPAAGLAAIFVCGAAGALVWVRSGNPRARFPAVSVSAAAALLVLLL